MSQHRSPRLRPPAAGLLALVFVASGAPLAAQEPSDSPAARIGLVLSGDGLPLHRLFFLGGSNRYPVPEGTFVTFDGLRTEERSGPHVQALAVGARIAVARRLFLTLRAKAGNAFERWNWTLAADRYVFGGAASLGWLSPAGPVELHVAGSGEREGPLLQVNLGHVF